MHHQLYETNLRKDNYRFQIVAHNHIGTREASTIITLYLYIKLTESIAATVCIVDLNYDPLNLT